MIFRVASNLPQLNAVTVPDEDRGPQEVFAQHHDIDHQAVGVAPGSVASLLPPERVAANADGRRADAKQASEPETRAKVLSFIR